ncbi:aminoacylase-1-like isoform X2 [Ostrinia furnacalis]|uniref:aminoacylase-1-like isoform X2 n=1 Tax=Ostrinia furnacalis TaxID=93504 RepID=UPI001039D649|nr:aminoacylase-1-like isoform X2 [Ostrinia furnacalis]
MSAIKDEVIERFREYLRIPSVQPDVDYSDCVKFLKGQAKDLDLPVAVHELVPRKPVVVITWAGTDPKLPTILLNSHMDVVPVYEEHWTHPPFEAVISEDGFIYARGTQDMKGVGMMHLEAVRALKNNGVRLKRTVHVSFVPDEEIGSADGMEVFSKSEEFRRLNVGFGLDESMPGTGDVYEAFNGERTSRPLKVTCTGIPGHGSLLNDNTAGEKLHYVISKFMKLREEERKKLVSGTPYGNVITVNLTQTEGGVLVNVLPEFLSVSFDMRIPPDLDHQELEDMIKSWCEEAGDGVTLEYYKKNPEIKSTRIDGSIPFWTAMKSVVNDMGYKMNCTICPGATDARFVRNQGIPVISFSPIINTPRLLHAHDERIHVDEYRRGISVMEKILTAVANV